MSDIGTETSVPVCFFLSQGSPVLLSDAMQIINGASLEKQENNNFLLEKMSVYMKVDEFLEGCAHLSAKVHPSYILIDAKYENLKSLFSHFLRPHT